MSVWALIMAAGAGARMGLGFNKALMPIDGIPMLQRSAEAFYGIVDGIAVVTRAEDIKAVRELSLRAMVVGGGVTRQQSVLRGLQALPEGAAYVLVHDAARPFVSKEVIQRCIASVKAHGSGVASVPVSDTIKQVGDDNIVIHTPPRASLRAAQTPQAFGVAALRSAIELLESRGETHTDDASAMEATGHMVMLVNGAPENRKITTQADLAWAESFTGGRESPMTRIGIGYDVHRLVAGRPLYLCGICVPSEKGLLGHSDADVALHALTDALLGAAAMGDIGRHFPDTDPAYKGIASSLLLTRTVQLLRDHGFVPQQLDLTIVAEKPKIAPYIPAMAQRVADLLCVPQANVNIKATTTEGLGFEGEGLGISAHAVVIVAQQKTPDESSRRE